MRLAPNNLVWVANGRTGVKMARIRKVTKTGFVVYKFNMKSKRWNRTASAVPRKDVLRNVTHHQIEERGLIEYVV